MAQRTIKLANDKAGIPEENKGFLVKVDIHLIGGGQISAVDAFRAPTMEEAQNMALNVFITGGGMIMYGNAAIVLDAVAAIQLNQTDFIDLGDPFNKQWLASVEVFERFMEEQQSAEQKVHRPRTAITEPGS
jgi:hypothetical protein